MAVCLEACSSKALFQGASKGSGIGNKNFPWASVSLKSWLASLFLRSLFYAPQQCLLIKLAEASLESLLLTTNISKCTFSHTKS